MECIFLSMATVSRRTQHVIMLHVYCTSFSALFSPFSEFRSNKTKSCRPVRPDSKFIHIRNLWLLTNLPNLCSLESIVKLGSVWMGHKIYPSSTSSWKIQEPLPSGEFISHPILWNWHSQFWIAIITRARETYSSWLWNNNHL